MWLTFEILVDFLLTLSPPLSPFNLQSMISATRMSATARAATLRPQMPTLKSSHAQRTLIQASSYSTSQSRAVLPLNSLPANRPVAQILSPYAILPLTRSFHAATSLWQQQQQQQQKEQQKEQQSEDAKDEKDGESKEEGKSGEEKKDAPPPPPHGDKSPWQVFRETLQSEFKASKEWEESTKALASSAHDFKESENIKKARAAYEAASGAASSRTSTVFKTTGKAIGTGAAWTWNTGVVKGLRKGVNATGEGLEKATRPVRETEAYKNVKDAIDDGSSSRYGGWIEKEERRKQRQLREQLEAKAGHKSGPMVEDPK